MELLLSRIEVTYLASSPLMCGYKGLLPREIYQAEIIP